MTTLREAAQQALEALRGVLITCDWHTDDGRDACSKADAVLDTLKAALAEHYCDTNCTWLDHAEGCVRAEPTGKQSLQVDPVAWMHTDPDKPRVRFLEWREEEPGYRGRWIKTPLYTAPAQRLSLTDEEISDLWDGHTVPVFGKTGINPIVFARAIEQAHGIKEKSA